MASQCEKKTSFFFLPFFANTRKNSISVRHSHGTVFLLSYILYSQLNHPGELSLVGETSKLQKLEGFSLWWNMEFNSSC